MREPLTAGIDVGTSSVKVVVMHIEGASETILSEVCTKTRKRDIASVVEDAFAAATAAAGVRELAYVATTGDGEDVPFATGHFYGMTTHARGALFLAPQARAVLDVGALHTRAVAMDERGRVLNTKMTSQCASGSGQFLENIARYLGVSQAEIGDLSKQADAPETVSSICAVLAETDVINMVSRGISTPNILRGIHESMAGRFARLLVAVGAKESIFVSGGLAQDVGLIHALDAALPQPADGGAGRRVVTSPRGVYAGAIGAAIWGEFRARKLGMKGAAWKAQSAA
jgi:benzoyl-CoA reductase subunit D